MNVLLFPGQGSQVVGMGSEFYKNFEILPDTYLFSKIKNTVLRLIPWRKGPFDFFGCGVNTEWNSALKWHRLSDRIEDLRGRLVLDVGSGNGYFAFRMVLEGARAVLCLEPSLQSFVQFRFCKHL